MSTHTYTKSTDFFGNPLISMYIDKVLTCQFDWNGKGFEQGFYMFHPDKGDGAFHLGNNLTEQEATYRFAYTYENHGFNIVKSM